MKKVESPVKTLAMLLGALCIALLVPGGAMADLLRCKGPDGKTVYTDDKSVCPDAKPFVPEGHVSGPSGAPVAKRHVSGSSRVRRAPIQGDAEAVERAEAARWLAKRTEKESELEALAGRREELKGFVAVCNRRGRVVTFDEAGIKRELPCKDVQKQFAQLDEDETVIREYLERGLADECRRAGCLPGWIR